MQTLLVNHRLHMLRSPVCTDERFHCVTAEMWWAVILINVTPPLVETTSFRESAFHPNEADLIKTVHVCLSTPNSGLNEANPHTTEQELKTRHHSVWPLTCLVGSTTFRL